MKYEIKSISSMSVLVSSVPAVLFVLGLLGGLLTFLVIPNPEIEPMTAGTRVLATGIFAVLYMVLMVGLMMVITFMYNLFTTTVGLRGIQLDIEGLEQDDVAPE